MSAPPPNRHISRRLVLGGTATVVALGTTRLPVASAAPPVVIADTRRTLPVVIPADAHDDVQAAAQEIAEYVELVTGQTPPIVSAAPSGPAIWLDSAAADHLGSLTVPDHPHGFALRISADGVAVAGATPRGALYGTYELLERCGVRWLTPGPHGTALPDDRLAAVQTEITSTPHFNHRALQGLTPYSSVRGDSPVDPHEAEQWYRRQRLDDVSYGAHGIPLWPETSKSSDPDLYVQVNGAPTNQLNVTLPEVLDRAEAGIRRLLEQQPGLTTINLGPADGGGFGEATPWDVEGRIDPLYGELVVTDRYIKFFNLLLDRLADHPDLKLAFYAYHLYMEPPVREQPNPRIIPVFAPIAVDRRKSIDDDDGWERRYVLRVIEEWKALGVDWMFRGYLGNLADPGLPYSPVRQVAAEMPEYAARWGASGGFRLEMIAGWGHQGPAMYLASRLMWDPTADASAIMDDWFRAAFGAAHATMARYFDRLGEAIATAPFTAGGMFDLPDSLPQAAIDQLTRDLDRAVQISEKTKDTNARARIEVVARAHQFGCHVIDSWRAQLTGHTDLANESLVLAREAHDHALQLSPAPVYPGLGWYYLERYHGQSVDATVAARTEFGVPVVETPRSWEVLVDDAGTGELPGDDDGSWSTIDAHLTWSAQGLRYLKAQLWYRCSLPGIDVAGRPRLLFPSVDENSQVWLNGAEATALTGPRSFNAMQFDLGASWSPTGPNHLLVLATNKVLDELGTGGLLGTGLVFADQTTPWTPATAPRPIDPQPTAGPTAPPPPTGTDRVEGTWEVILDPVHAVARLGLHDARISSQHFRPYDPQRAPLDQGLGRYSGGLVVRSTVAAKPRRVLLLATTPDTQLWVNSQPVDLIDRGDGWCEATIPEHRGRQVHLAIAQPRLGPDQSGPLSPRWQLRR